jgi:phage terminase large subunit-like protein
LLAAHQQRILRAALERDALGRFRWTTVVYSCPKKSGKTRVAALVAAWLAATMGRYNEIYCLANDGKQSADRVLAAVKKANELGRMGWRDKMTRIELPNGSFIEAVPVDPTGEAGANPTATLWSEMWGFRLSAKERLWSEFTIPPTRYGKAIRWVESYAGYTGESPVLEQLYHEGVEEGKRHPDFPDLPVYVNDRARLLCYWDHEPRMAWQTPEYYQAEAALLHPSEFERIHRNTWVSAIGQAIPVESWDRCLDMTLPAQLSPQTPIVLGLDAGVSGDCTALVVVSRHPQRERHNDVAIRAVEVWEPPAGGKMDYAETIEKSVRRWVGSHNVVCVVYDPYQLHKMATDLRKGGLGWFEEFSQGAQRAVADKQFVDLVLSRKLAHRGDETLRQHVANAAAKTLDEKSLRFVKRSDKLKIDALVAASMAAYQALRLNL